jgi:hypothetical protein
MAAYILPVFNLSFDWWNPNHVPNAVPPDDHTVGQLYMLTKPSGEQAPLDNNQWPQIVIVRVPLAFCALHPTELYRSFFRYTDTFSGTLRHYYVRWWDTVHAGFPNEYGHLTVSQCSPNGSRPDSTR